MPKTFDGGAVVNHEAPRFDLIPPVALYAIAQRFAVGAAKYGVGNYQKSLHDPEFLKERANHAIEHLVHYVNGTGADGDSPSDNLAAVGWAVAVLLEAERLKEEQKARQVACGYREVKRSDMFQAFNNIMFGEFKDTLGAAKRR